MDARQKLYDLKEKQIQQDQTLFDLQNNISKARNEGDLLALAAAQNSYNNELNRQNEENAKARADEKDKSRIESIQGKMDADQEAFDKKMQAMQDAHDAKIENMQNQMQAIQDSIAEAQKNAKDNSSESMQLTDKIVGKMKTLGEQHKNDAKYNPLDDKALKGDLDRLGKLTGLGDSVKSKFNQTWKDIKKLSLIHI